MGAGNDQLGIFRLGARHDVTLGECADTVKLYGSISGATRAEGSIVIQDFLAGNGGDRFDLEDYLRAKLQGWTTDQNPFATGHLKLVQSGADTLLQIDIDGSAGGAGFTTLATLRNTTPQSFTAANFGGRDPFASTGPSVIDGSAGNDTLTGTDRDDTIRGFGGDDRLDGGRGSASKAAKAMTGWRATRARTTFCWARAATNRPTDCR